LLIRALAFPSPDIPPLAAQILQKIGKPAADLLFQAMQERPEIQLICAETLASQGDARAAIMLVPFLACFLQPEGERAALALVGVGDAETLPRNIVAETRLTVYQRIEILKWLDRLRFYRWDVAFMSPLPDVPGFCQRILRERETRYHEGARQILSHY